MSRVDQMSAEDIVEDRPVPLETGRDPEALEEEIPFVFDIGDEVSNDQAKLSEVGVKILEGQASNEDYKIVRDMAAKYLPGQVFKFSPVIMGRSASLESIESLKRYASAGVAVALVLALVALIDKIFPSNKSGGASSSAKQSDRLEKVVKAHEVAIDKLSKATSLKDAALVASTIKPADVAVITSPDTTEQELEKNHTYRTLSAAIGKQTDLSPPEKLKLVKKLVKLVAAYSRFLGTGEDDYDSLKSHFEKGLDLHYSMTTAVFLDGKNKWARMAFLSAEGFNPTMALTTITKVLEIYGNAYPSHIAGAEDLIAYLDGKSSTFDLRKYNEHVSLQLKVVGIDPTDLRVIGGTSPITPKKELLTEEQARGLNNDIRKAFQLLEPNQVVVKNVLSKMIGADQKVIIDELGKFDELGRAANTVKNIVGDPNKRGSLVEVIEVLEKSKKNLKIEGLETDERFAINRTIRLLEVGVKVSGNLITAAGNFDRGVEGYSVQVANFMDAYAKIAEMVEDIEKVERKASTESFTLEDDESLTTTETVGLHMREIHIPERAILPHGIDRNALRDLVEEDPSNWTGEELDEFVSGAQASLESLYTDINMVNEVKWRIQRSGLICRGDVQQLEKIHPGLITSQTPIGRFTSFESVNYSKPSLEAAANLATGAQAAAGIAAIAILAKILQWCYKRFQASRDVTKSIKGNVDVLGKINDQTISTITGMNARVEALEPDAKGKLNEESKKYYSEKMLRNDWFNIQDIEKSMMELRTNVFVKNHEKSYSELVDSLIKGEDAFKLIKVLTEAAEKGAATLDKAVDNVANQIDQMKSAAGGNGNTESVFKGLEYGLDNFRIKDLDLSKATSNIGRAELITGYVTAKKDEKLGKEKLANVEVDKLNARLSELASRLKEVSGRVESDFKKLQQRLDKLEKVNASASEKDDSEGSASANREAVKSFIKSVQAEFDAYSKIVGAQSAVLKILDAEIKHYGTTLKEWGNLTSWQNKKIASSSKNGSKE